MKTTIEKIEKGIIILAEFSNDQQDFIRGLVKLSYNEGLEKGQTLPLDNVIVILPKFKEGQTLKRPSKYTNDYIYMTVESIEKTEKGYRYISTNDVWYYEDELLEY